VKKILLADDEPALRRLVAATLADEARFEILHAANGQEALDIARAEQPTVLLLDVNMPGLDGYQVCRELKSDPATAGIVIFMLTANAEPQDQERGFAAGADGYFKKPFSPLALLERVEAVLED
jgi:CheY-like chemotaxis protein